MDEFNVNVQKVQGGYIVNGPYGTRVETDLEVVLEFVRKELLRELVLPIDVL